MNKLVLTTLVAALSGVLAAPKVATAGDDEVAAAVGGFIGGVIFGSAIDHDDNVRVTGHVAIGSRGRGHHHHRHGYWEWTRVRVWVPGRWVVSYDRHGDRVRYFERGHYMWRRERAWVPTRDHRRCDDDRGYDREYDRDYDRDGYRR